MFLLFKIFNWRIIALQYCVGFCHTSNVYLPTFLLRRWVQFFEQALPVSQARDTLRTHHYRQMKMPPRFSSVQSLSRVQLFVTPWTAARQASLTFTISQNLLKTHVHRVSDAIQPSHPLSSPFPPALYLSQHQSLFKWVSSSHQVANKY